MVSHNMNRLVRSSDNVMIAGVCAGVADFFGLEVSRIRLITLLLILFAGLSLWAYIILWIILPKGPKRLNP